MGFRLPGLTRANFAFYVGFIGLIGTGLGVDLAFDVASYDGRPWQAWVAALLTGLIGTAISLVFARQLHRFTQRAQKMEGRELFLEDFSEYLSGALDHDSAIQRLASLLIPLLGDECLIDISEDSRNVRRTTSAGQVTTFALGSTSPLSETPVLFDDGSGLSAPLRARDRTFGTVTLLWTTRPHRFDADDLSFASDVVRRAALALDNARLFTELEKANRVKDEFLTTLSHELRTPMNVIQGWVDILRQEEVDHETYRAALETVNRNVNLQIQLIDDLLDVSRMSNGKFVLMIEERDVAPIAAQALKSLAPAAAGKSIELSLTVGPGTHIVPIDDIRFRQVLWNLLTNALKFTSPGGHIALGIESQGENTKISVRDDGQGIDPSFIPHVFDRFRQEDGTFTRSQGGLGIGLSIAYHLVELHGGRLTAESAGRGKGATFTVHMKRNVKFNETMSRLQQAQQTKGPTDHSV